MRHEEELLSGAINLRFDGLDAVHASKLVKLGESEQTLQQLGHTCLVCQTIAEELNKDSDYSEGKTQDVRRKYTVQSMEQAIEKTELITESIPALALTLD